MATVANKRQRPLPLLVAEVVVSPGAAYFVQQFIGQEATAQGDADQVLDQHVQRLVWGFAGLDHPGFDGVMGSSGFDQLQAVGRHQCHARRTTRRVARAPGALHQARDAFGRTDLQHALDR